VVLAVMLAPPADPPKQPTVQLSADEYVDQFLNAPVDEWETRAGLLAEEVADYHVRLALGEPWSLDLDITRVEEEITGFGLAVEEEAPTEWDAWNIPL